MMKVNENLKKSSIVSMTACSWDYFMHHTDDLGRVLRTFTANEDLNRLISISPSLGFYIL